MYCKFTPTSTIAFSLTCVNPARHHYNVLALLTPLFSLTLCTITIICQCDDFCVFRLTTRVSKLVIKSHVQVHVIHSVYHLLNKKTAKVKNPCQTALKINHRQFFLTQFTTFYCTVPSFPSITDASRCTLTTIMVDVLQHNIVNYCSSQATQPYISKCVTFHQITNTLQHCDIIIITRRGAGATPTLHPTPPCASQVRSCKLVQ